MLYIYIFAFLLYIYIFFYTHRAINAVNSQSEYDMTNVSSARGVRIMQMAYIVRI